MSEGNGWTADDARQWVAVPGEADDKYTRGVLGVVTGSDRYPGAAVLSVQAAARTGVGMVRYRGAAGPAEEVLRRRPEAVTAPGRVQAWVLGSGMDVSFRTADDTARLRQALGERTPLVIDAGALDLLGEAAGPVVITPHCRELAAVLAAAVDSVSPRSAAVTPDDIREDPAGWAQRAAASLGVTVLLKGHTTHIATPAGHGLAVASGPAWLATAGTGDVLAGVLGALVATHADAVRDRGHDALAALAATAVWLHGQAGERASRGAPIVALDVAEALPSVLRDLLAGNDRAHPL